MSAIDCLESYMTSACFTCLKISCYKNCMANLNNELMYYNATFHG